MINGTVRRLAANRKGFTLIELLVVVLIIGILAAIAVPQYFKVVEKGRVSEAVSWIQAVKGSQERRALKMGSYSTSTGLDLTPTNLNAYTASAMTPNGSTSWAVTLTRNTAVPSYGAYVITFNSATTPPFTCGNASCQADLMP